MVGQVELYNFCTEEFEKKLGKCEEGYNLITIFILPTETLLSEKGDAQFYFNFSDNKKLEGKFYELYYPEHHQ